VNRIEGKTSTKERLASSALALFSRYWYETVSVAEICRAAELSNGIFYRYYENKEEVFRALLDEYLERLSSKLEDISGDTTQERLRSFLRTVVRQIREDWQLVSVYREGQYRFPEYERRLRDIYVRAASTVYGREIDEAEYVYVVGGVRFAAIRWLSGTEELDTSVIEDMVLNGVFTCSFEQPDRIFPTELVPLDDEEDTSRARLLGSGVELFGSRGYYNVNVYEVARNAGYSVGTFYLYFKTKEQFLAEIVRYIGRRTRHFITINLDDSLNRLERELQGLYLFLTHFSQRPEYYRIVREAEFVVHQEANRYYDKFEEGYLKNLTGTRHEDADSKRVIANCLLGVSHYCGIEVLYSHNITNQYQVILQLGRFLHEGVKP
jgi:AcrR family transcriptional regulator